MAILLLLTPMILVMIQRWCIDHSTASGHTRSCTVQVQSR